MLVRQDDATKAQLDTCQACGFGTYSVVPASWAGRVMVAETLLQAPSLCQVRPPRLAPSLLPHRGLVASEACAWCRSARSGRCAKASTKWCRSSTSGGSLRPNRQTRRELKSTSAPSTRAKRAASAAAGGTPAGWCVGRVRRGTRWLALCAHRVAMLLRRVSRSTPPLDTPSPSAPAIPLSFDSECGRQAVVLGVLLVLFLVAWWFASWVPFFQHEARPEECRDQEELPPLEKLLFRARGFARAYGKTFFAYTKVRPGPRPTPNARPSTHLARSIAGLHLLLADHVDVR